MAKYLFILLTLVMISGCTTVQTIDTPTSINPDPTELVTFTPTSSSTPSLTITPVPVYPHTPTPILYTVVLNDTLTGIAAKFNITLQELLAANPSADSQALTVGTTLTIPTGQELSNSPTVTPLPVTIQQKNCFPNQDGSLWCLVLLKNDSSAPLQNLSVLINLQSSDQTIFNSQAAYAPLDVLPPGLSLVVSTLFQKPIPVDFQILAQILSASHLANFDNLYLPISLQNSLVQIDWGGLSARVRGEAILGGSAAEARRVWILGVAYDEAGNVIGFRRWESNSPLSTGESLSFDFLVASLGPEIDHVDLILEAAK
jgi:LysM repeat protein